MFDPDGYLLHELIGQLGQPSHTRKGLAHAIDGSRGETVAKAVLEYSWPCGCVGILAGPPPSDSELVVLTRCATHHSLDAHFMPEIVDRLGQPAHARVVLGRSTKGRSEIIKTAFFEYRWPCGCVGTSSGPFYLQVEYVSLKRCPTHEALPPSRSVVLALVCDFCGFTADDRAEMNMSEAQAQELVLVIGERYPAYVSKKRLFRDGALLDALKAGDLDAAKAAVRAMT